MMIKFFPRGRGCGAGPVDYVCASHNHQGHARKPEPQILYGEPEVIRRVIDAIPFRHKYSSGVISFASEDSPSVAQQEEVIRNFEQTAFPGLEGNQYSILWVRHVHAGRVELHFVIPRIELTSGKACNPAPPSWQDRYDLLRDMFNWIYGWARPDDPARARPVQLGVDALIKADKQRKGQDTILSCKEILSQKILAQVHARKIHDRKDVINYLRGEGFSLPRIGKDYITIINPADGKRHRLKGLLFNEDFSAKDFLNRHPPVNIIDAEKATHAQKSLARKLLAVTDYNQTRYLQKENAHDPRTIFEYGSEAQEIGRTADQGFPIFERRSDRYELPRELYDHTGEHTPGSGRGTSGTKAGGIISERARRQDREPQDIGRSRQFLASGNDGHQKYASRSIASIYQKLINALWAEIRSVQSDAVFLRKVAMKKKLKSMPKVAPSRKSFASLLQAALLPPVGALKKASMDLRHATARHRLKHIPKMQPRHTDAQILTQQITAFCAKRMALVFEEANSIKIMAQSFITKKQEMQRKQQSHTPITQEHEVIMHNDAQPFATPPASLGTSPTQKQSPTYTNALHRKRMKDAFKQVIQSQNRPSNTIEEKKNQILGAALQVWSHNPHLDFEQISLGLKYYIDFRRADIIELENRLWFNRPAEVRQRVAEEETLHAEDIKSTEVSQEEMVHDI